VNGTEPVRVERPAEEATPASTHPDAVCNGRSGRRHEPAIRRVALE
jgi:hypothetical protein